MRMRPPLQAGVGSYERECKTLYIHYGGAGTLPTDQVPAVAVCQLHACLLGYAALCCGGWRAQPWAAHRCCGVGGGTLRSTGRPLSLLGRMKPRRPGRPPPCASPPPPSCKQLRKIVADNFSEWGPLENVHLVPAKTLAFVR